MKFGDFHKKRKRALHWVVTKIFQPKPQVNFDALNVKKIVFLHDNGKLGDMIVSTPLYRDLHKHGIDVSVISLENTACILESNPHISNVFTHDESLPSVLRLARKLSVDEFDLLIDCVDWCASYKEALLINMVKPKFTVGFDSLDYNISLNSEKIKNLHMSKRNEVILDFLEIHDGSPDYDLHINQDVDEKVNGFVNGLPHKKTLLINPFGQSHDRCLSERQLQAIVDLVHEEFEEINIIINVEPHRRSLVNAGLAVLSPFTDFQSAMALVKKSDFIVSVDTSIIHVAAAFQKPILVLYQADRFSHWKNSESWGPNNVLAEKLQGNTTDIADISEEQIVSRLRNMMACKLK